MITYQNMTPSQTFEERIVSVVNTGIDATATKIVCVTNGNLLRYKTDTNANFESRIVSVANTGIDTTATKVLVITDGNLLRYKTDTNANFEERIVSIANTGIDATSSKILCVTNGNLLRYKSLIPIVTRIYSGNFSTATTSETIIFNLPSGIKFEDIIAIDFKAYYNTALSSWNIGICWAQDFDNTIYFGSNTSTTFKMYRKSSRMTSAPYKITIQYFAS